MPRLNIFQPPREMSQLAEWDVSPTTTAGQLVHVARPRFLRGISELLLVAPPTHPYPPHIHHPHAEAPALNVHPDAFLLPANSPPLGMPGEYPFTAEDVSPLHPPPLSRTQLDSHTTASNAHSLHKSGQHRRTNTNGQTYSFVSLPGIAYKRPRRRYDEVERLYQCSWPDCNKGYGTLNHLNTHITMRCHGPKRKAKGTSIFVDSIWADLISIPCRFRGVARPAAESQER